MRVGIVTDSTASLSAQDADREGIIVVPLQVCVDDDTYTEGIDLAADQIAEALQDGKQVTPSRPSPQAFHYAYQSQLENGVNEILSIHLSPNTTDTDESIRRA